MKKKRKRNNKALAKVVAIIGGQSELARKLGVKQQTVNQWLDSRTPSERVLSIEKLVSAQVTRHELREDLYPLE